MLARTLLLAALATSALGAVGCAPGVDEEEEAGDAESNLKSGGKAACPTAGRLSQGFSGKHDGVDLANGRGTPIFAVSAGRVTASGPASGYGQWIRIEHDDGSMTEYGHMFQRDVKVGQRVSAGQRIALMGSEGRSTGNHLHLRTYQSASRIGAGSGMNPVSYLKARGISLPCQPGVASKSVPGDTADQIAADDLDDNDEVETDGANVTAWKDADVHEEATTDSPVIGQIRDNQRASASCWSLGERIQSDGYTNDRWVRISLPGAGAGFVSGIFLKGDKSGGVSTRCQ